MSRWRLGGRQTIQMHWQTPWQHISLVTHIHISETSLSNRVFFFCIISVFFLCMQSKGFSCIDYICIKKKKKEPACGLLLTSDFHICQYNPRLVIICTVVELSLRLNLSGLGEMWGLIPSIERPNRPWLTACIQARDKCIIIYHLLSLYCYWFVECC